MLLAEKLTLNDDETVVTAQKPTPHSYRRLQGKMMLILGLLFASILGNMIVQGLVIQQNQRIQVWQKKIDEKQRELVKLRMEIADLDSFDRIQKIAQNELGMREAGPQDYNLIKSVPGNHDQLTPPTRYLAEVPEQTGLWATISSWFGEIGKTMAKSPH